MDSNVRKAVILLSGGLDSATVLAMAVRENYAVHALTFRYGQSHAAEVEAAERIAKKLGAARHVVMDIDLGRFGGSALTGDGEIPKDRPIEAMAKGIPATYVPARNTIFLSYALAWAEVLEAQHIFIGVNALDYSGYPDCRPEYIAAFQRLANLATKAGVEGGSLKIHTPLIDLSKAEIIREGTALGVDYGMTRTCYDPSPEGEACGACDACSLRLKGFAEAGLTDPAPYRSHGGEPPDIPSLVPRDCDW